MQRVDALVWVLVADLLALQFGASVSEQVHSWRLERRGFVILDNGRRSVVRITAACLSHKTKIPHAKVNYLIDLTSVKRPPIRNRVAPPPLQGGEQTASLPATTKVPHAKIH